MAAHPPASTPLRGRLITPALALAAGIAGAARLDLPTLLTTVTLLVGLLLILIAIWRPLFFRPHHPTPPDAAPLFSLATMPAPVTLLTLLVPLTFLLAGYHLAKPQLSLPSAPSHLCHLLFTGETAKPAANRSHDVVLTGVLQEMPRQSGERTRLLMAAEELRRPASVVATHGLVQLTLNGRPPPLIKPGGRLMVRARVGPVRAFTVPGAFDYRQFMAHRDIHLSGWVATPRQLTPVFETTPMKLTHRLYYLPERWRQSAGNRLNQHLAGEENLPVLRALLIGDRSGIEAATLENFKASGAMHLLAISGMHLGLIALLSMGACEWLLKRSPYLLHTIHVRKAALLLALLPIIGYALITGLQPPAQRALIMTLVFIGAVLCNRQWCSLNNLALAALIILVMNPPAPFGASFQLSFAATAGIIMLVPALQRRDQAATTGRRRLLFWVTTSLLVSTVATLVTAPLAMHHFHRVSLLSPLTTLLATPLIFFWTLPLALVGLALTTIGEVAAINAAAGLLLTAASRGLDLTVTLTDWLAALPGSFFYFAPPSPAEFLCWATLLAALALIRRHWLFPATVATMVLMLGLLPVYEQWQRGRATASQVSFIEVGHGNATVVEMPGNRTVLVDGGGPATLSTDVGEQLIAPFLRRRRIRRLEAVVISHPHADHYNGVTFLLRHFRPATLWVNGSAGEAEDYQELIDLATEMGIEVRVPDGGEEILAARNPNGRPLIGRVRNLANFHLRAPGDFSPPLQYPVNDQSLVISYRHGDVAFLLPGDISTAQERRLVERYGGQLGHQVLAASHHGRRTSMAPEFLAATGPQFLVVSDNEQRVDQQRLTTWRRKVDTVFSTGRHGTIVCTTDGRELTCRPTRTAGTR